MNNNHRPPPDFILRLMAYKLANSSILKGEDELSHRVANYLQKMLEHDVMRMRVKEIKDADNHYFMLDGQPALFQDIVRAFEQVKRECGDA